LDDFGSKVKGVGDSESSRMTAVIRIDRQREAILEKKTKNCGFGLSAASPKRRNGESAAHAAKSKPREHSKKGQKCLRIGRTSERRENRNGRRGKSPMEGGGGYRGREKAWKEGEGESSTICANLKDPGPEGTLRGM